MKYNIDLTKANEARDYLQQIFGNDLPKIGLILGSGFGDFVKTAKIIKSIPYSHIPNFVQGDVAGHKGQLTLMETSGITILVMEGRFHYYEGFAINQIIFPIVVLDLLGIKNLIITNAAGAINANFKVGDFMLINDHINFTGNSPLIGYNDLNVGPRFLDLTEPYSKYLLSIAREAAKESNLSFHEGVYLGVIGPNYETKAEINAFRILGADAVGMSTVHEVIMANYLRMGVLALSNITNMATGISKTKHTHQEVVEEASRSIEKFSSWINKVIIKINQ